MAEMVLTREEVREARRLQDTHQCEMFMHYDFEGCGHDPERFAHCALCEKLTEFAKGEEDE